MTEEMTMTLASRSRRAAIALAAVTTMTIAHEARADRPNQLTVAIFAPSVELSTGGLLSLVNELASAIEAKTGIKTTGKAYSSYADLAAAHPDFAVIDPFCLAAHPPGRVLATARIDGDTSRRWGLFAARKIAVSDLSGKAVAYARTGCRDTDFIEHGVFLGLLRFGDFFSGGVAQSDINGAVVATRDVHKADAVVAPAGVASGLELILPVDSVPNPGFVVVSKTLDASIADQARGAISGVGGGPIEGWGGAVAYGGLTGRMATAKKRMIFASPERAQVAEADVVRLAPPKMASSWDASMLWQPPKDRGRR